MRKIRQNYSRVPDQTDRQLREIIANYYGMISLIDHNVGRVLAALADLGLADDTLAIYTADHGDWLGDHGLILKGPINYEGLVRVGLIFQGPSVPRDRVVDDPVSTLDIPATVLDYMGVSPGGEMHGRSLKGLVDGKDGEGRDFAYNEWDINASRCGVALDLRMARTRTHKLTIETGSSTGELYDLKSDPHEMDNLFDDDGARSVRKELEDMISSRPDDEVEVKPTPVGMA